jgi:hypothetical protein
MSHRHEPWSGTGRSTCDTVLHRDAFAGCTKLCLNHRHVAIAVILHIQPSAVAARIENTYFDHGWSIAAFVSVALAAEARSATAHIRDLVLVEFESHCNDSWSDWQRRNGSKSAQNLGYESTRSKQVEHARVL